MGAWERRGVGKIARSPTQPLRSSKLKAPASRQLSLRESGRFSVHLCRVRNYASSSPS